jgi:hypothetical protein
MSLNIPDGELPVLMSLARLSDEDFGGLAKAISKSKPAMPTRFMEATAEQVPQIKDAGAIINTLFALCMMRDRALLPAEELATDVADAAEREKPKFFAPKDVETLKTRLAILLKDQSLGVAAKAADVLTEHSNVFCEARMLSDIRPVFAGDGASAPAALIVHNLQIGFHSAGRHQEFYVALDTDDIKKLKQVIERAERKTTALQGIIEKSGTTYLKV